MLKKPVFVSGLRKSGTSMTRLLMDGHPELFVPPPNELRFMGFTDIPALCTYKEEASSFIDEIKELILSDKVVNGAGNKKSHMWREEFDLEAFKEELRGRDCADMKELIANTMVALANSCSHFSGDPWQARYVIKGVMQTEYFLELKAMFPDMQMVYVLRNPYAHYAAVVRAYRTHSIVVRGGKHYGRAKDVKLTWRDRYPFIVNHINYMKASYCLMDKFAKLYPESFKVVIFDEILKDPRAALTDLSSFLGVEFDESMLCPTLFGKVWVGNSMINKKDYEGISQKPLHHWKDKINSAEVQLINTHFKWVIDKYGFDFIESNASFYKPFHYTEFFKRYIANRIGFFLR